MKNILSKISVLVAITLLSINGAIFVNAQNTDSLSTEESVSITESTTVNESLPYGMGMMTKFGGDNIRFGRPLNLNPNPIIKDFIPGIFMAFAGLGLVFAIVGILLLAFWIWMLVHAVKNDIDYKPVWILVLWFLNIIGAIIYYFAVKKDYVSYEDMEEVCVCEDGKCVCGQVNAKEVYNIKENLE